jgi:uncharacterized damage-inducible protein DinB
MTATLTLTDRLAGELTQEAATTRRVLERVPEDKLSWRPHPKSMSLGELALHVAQIPGATAEFFREPAREAPTFGTRPEARSVEELLTAQEESQTAASAQLASWSDDDLATEWRMTRDGATILALPRIDMVRAVMFNHLYHHRGELIVYLRLLDVRIPFVYGPSADENPFAA